ncbi:MAG: hypothetical protein DI551_04360, partial [Micavibrio aeruginosavorus]
MTPRPSTIDLDYAMAVGRGERAVDDPIRKGEIIFQLQDHYWQAHWADNLMGHGKDYMSEDGTKVRGYTSRESYNAILNILDSQSHSPQFTNRIDAIAEEFMPKDAQSMGRFAHWNKLDDYQKRQTITQSVDALSKLIKHHFDLDPALEVETKFVYRRLDYHTGRYGTVILTNAAFVDLDDPQR